MPFLPGGLCSEWQASITAETVQAEFLTYFVLLLVVLGFASRHLAKVELLLASLCQSANAARAASCAEDGGVDIRRTLARVSRMARRACSGLAGSNTGREPPHLPGANSFSETHL